MHSVDCRLGVFGGRFDPVHFGHLRTAFEVRQLAKLDEVAFLPTGQPPHREMPDASAEIRARMLRAAIAGQDGFSVDERELGRPGPSYTVTTLEELGRDRPNTALCLILGLDAFIGLPTWHQWPRILTLAHIVVARRPGSELPDDGPLAELLAEQMTSDVDELSARPHGAILIAHVTQLEVSSTALKDSIAAGMAPTFLMPDAVWDIIRTTESYGARKN
jgi:nicotinate-nucleotide adenylyltransferase